MEDLLWVRSMGPVPGLLIQYALGRRAGNDLSNRFLGCTSFLPYCRDQMILRKTALWKKGLFGLQFQVMVHHCRGAREELLTLWP